MTPNLLRAVAFVLPFAAATIALAQNPDPALIGYWHNWNDAAAPYLPLDQIDPRYNVIEVAFAEPIVGTTYDMQFTPALTTPVAFTEQVAAHQAQGHKVLISIGGANATVRLNSDGERDQFVSSMMAIVTTYGFDGIDIDLEGASVSLSGGTIAAPTDAAINRLIDAIETIGDQFELANGVPMMLTMAPETAYVQGGMSAFGGIWGAYLPIIDALRDRIDILQVQLYNSGSMYGIDGGIYTQGTADFIVSQVEAVIQGFSTSGGFFDGLLPGKVAVGLPACASAAGGGYTDTATVRAAVEYLLGTGPQPGSYALAEPGGYPSLRGMMTWSVNWDAVASCNGAGSFAENYERIFGDLATGVNAPAIAAFSLYPNPVLEDLYFSDAIDGTIVIRDLSGRQVLRSTGSSSTRTLDVRSLVPDIYILEVQQAGQRTRVPFVKD